MSEVVAPDGTRLHTVVEGEGEPVTAEHADVLVAVLTEHLRLTGSTVAVITSEVSILGATLDAPTGDAEDLARLRAKLAEHGLNYDEDELRDGLARLERAEYRPRRLLHQVGEGHEPAVTASV